MTDGTSPTSRAIRTLEILRTRPGTTAEELAERLGVSDRAARRYVEILREAGIPVDGARGPFGGCRRGRGTTLPPVSFSEREALGLVMAVLDGHPAAGSDDDPIGGALGKVVRALPDGLSRQAAALREGAAAAPDAWSTRTDPTLASAILDAIAANRTLLVRYITAKNRDLEAEVEPWALVVRYGRWYLLCLARHVDAVRTYRVDRIASIERTEHRFDPPEDLDAVAVLEEHLGVGWEHPTRVVFQAPMDEIARWVNPLMGRLAEHAEGCVLEGSTSNPAMYAQEWLPMVPFPFRVEGGDELREAVAEVGRRFAAASAPAATS